MAHQRREVLAVSPTDHGLAGFITFSGFLVIKSQLNACMIITGTSALLHTLNPLLNPQHQISTVLYNHYSL